MTDTVPGASSLIGPATAADPAIEQAAARRAALIGDPEWRDRYLSGDPKARAEFSELHNTLAPAEAEAPAAQERDTLIATLQNFADIPQAVVDQIKADQSVTAHERRLAIQTKDRLMRDKEWVRRYLDGGVAERRAMTLCSIIIASPVQR